MKTQTISVAAGMAIMATGLLIYAIGSAAGQDSDTWFTPDAVDTANGILGSGLAQFLSGTGWTALERQSGRLVSVNAGVAGSPVRTLPFQSGRFEVMVNDPAQDVLAASDISTQSETAVAAFGDNVVVAFNDSTGFVTSRSGMGWSHSSDGGATFTDLGNLPVSPATQVNEGDPGIAVNRSGTFYASYILFDAARPAGLRNTAGVSKSVDGGFTWSSPVGLPVFGTANGFLDKPFIAADSTGGANDGHVYVTFTNFSPGSAGLPIMFSRSIDGGSTFSAPIQLSVLNTVNQGSEPVVGPKGEIYVAWFQFSGPRGSGIVEAKSTDGGLTFAAPVFVAPAMAIGFNSGSLLGNFRVNSFPRIDVDQSTGNVYITYASGPGNGDAGDVFFVRSTNGGATWSAPIRVNDEPGTMTSSFRTLPSTRLV
jgi:hypothetical protein